jgi:integrase
MKLTQGSIAKVKRDATGKADHFEWDEALPGFGLRVRNGQSTWVVQYKVGPKQQRRLTLGTTEQLTAEQARNGWLDEAGQRRDGAAKIIVSARDGFDAKVSRATRREEASHTLGVAIEKFLQAKRQGKKPISHNYDVALTFHLQKLLRSLHGLTLGAIKRKHVAAIVDTIASERGAVTANRCRGSLSAFYRWAIEKGLAESNPVAGTAEHAEAGPRERTLTDAEAAAVWLACPDNDYGRIVRLLMLTGCRRDEIGGLEWKEIDFDSRTIALPANRTKNNQAHAVPLSDAAMAILQDIPQRDRVHVFGIGPGGYAGWSKGKTNIDKIVQLPHWQIHDLRRTAATGMAGLGVQPHIIEAALNHISGHKAGVAGVYNRATYEPEKRAALELWASHLAVAIAQASGANVTSLRKTSQ